METWAIVTLVLGASAISSLLTFFITKMQVSHSDKRLEKQLESAREADYRERRREVWDEPLLRLRSELARMAYKQEKLVTAAHRLHTRPAGFTEEEVKKLLEEAQDEWNTYMASGDFRQTLLMQYDTELVNLVDEIQKNYWSSYIDGVYHKELKATELGEAMKILDTNKTKITEAQSLINKRREEL